MFKNFFLFVCFWVISVQCFGQTRILDSLFIELRKPSANNVSTDVLNEIAYNFHRIDIDSTKYYAKLALRDAQTYNLLPAHSTALNILGIAAIYKGEFEESINLNLKSYDIANEIKSISHISSASNGLSIGYDRVNDYDKSISYGRIALESAQKMRDTTSITYILTNLSELHFNESNFEKAKKYIVQAIDLGRQTDDCKLLSLTHLELGKLQFQEGEFNKSEVNLNTALAYSKECQDDYIPSLVFRKLSQINLKNNKLNIANSQIDKSTLTLKNMGEEYNLYENYLVKAQILNSLKRDTEAISPLLEGLALAKKNINLDFQNQYLERLIKIYSSQGDYSTALEYSTDRHIIQDSIATLNKAVSLLELEKKYNIEKKEVEVKLLTEQQNKNEQTIKSRNYLVVASTLFAALIGSIAFFTFLSLRRNADYSAKLEQEVGERTKELQTSNSMLVKSNQELERFAYISSHDLKEPLKNINSFTKLIKKESLETENTKINEYACILENCSNQLNTLVSDILDYSMVKNDLKIQNVDLNHIVGQLNADLDKTLRSNNAVIVTDNLPTIKTDKSSIYRVFKNLIENGIKYNDSSQPTINIRTEEANDELKLVFADNGIGIDNKHHEEIFMMFKRLHNKDNYAGSGIGLSTVKAIIEKLKGTIGIKSEPNVGSEFIITLPKTS